MLKWVMTRDSTTQILSLVFQVHAKLMTGVFHVWELQGSLNPYSLVVNKGKFEQATLER